MSVYSRRLIEESDAAEFLPLDAQGAFFHLFVDDKRRPPFQTDSIPFSRAKQRQGGPVTCSLF